MYWGVCTEKYKTEYGERVVIYRSHLAGHAFGSVFLYGLRVQSFPRRFQWVRWSERGARSDSKGRFRRCLETLPWSSLRLRMA